MEAVVALEQDSLAVRAGAEDIRSASEWLDRLCSERDVPAEQICRLDLCLNEALANIASYGGESALVAPVLLAVKVKAENDHAQATLTVSDSGKPFNPLAATARPQVHSLLEATPGGLGLTMISGYSDALDYDYLDERNHLKITVQWARSS
jgi:anti-sigma regulatory factor (Ser/Thr protein kinase)